MQLAGKVALVTGGGTGVGRATSLALAGLGCAVVVNYRRSRTEAEATATDVAALGVRSLAVQADVADDAACHDLVNSVTRAFGRLDILVNNAAVTRFISHTALDQVTDAVWEEIMSINVRGPFQCVRAARELLAEANGVVVNVASVAGLTGSGSSIPYAASKAALLNMTVSLARALAPKIRVNAVAPGFIEGRWLEQGLGSRYEAVKSRVESNLPLGRVARPEDVAAAIVSLITCTHITGQVLVCDGGLLIADPLAPRS